MAETKTSKVKELKSFGTQDDHGNWSHVVKFENGDSGFCKTKDQTGTAFAVGTEMEYTIEQRSKKDGSGTYFTVKKAYKEKSPYGFQGAAKGRDVKDYKCEAVMIAATNAANTISIREALSEKDFPAYFKAYLGPMMVEIDRIYAV
jgi:hypothetical protein